MKKKVFAVTLCLVLVFSVSACKKKEAQPPVPQTPGPMAPGPMPPGPVSPGPMTPGTTAPGPIMQGPVSPEGQKKMPGAAMTMPATEKKVVVPDTVKGKWSAVTLVVEDRIAKQTQEYKVNLHGNFAIPNSNVKVFVGDFLPDFKMDGQVLTSGANDPKNPAVSIRVFEGDKQIFPAPGKKWGWLFAKLPTVHPLKHPRYGIILKEGISKKG
ncbi:MAG: hypothetical protein FJ241_08185 [Nitrospira sp.]|nr:hypothetical protein [Nitrospira sp.]